MDVQEYLRTSFDEADCEFLDGQVIERNAGELEHSYVLGTLCLLLHRFRKHRQGGAVCDILRTENPEIAVPLEDAFNLDA